MKYLKTIDIIHLLKDQGNEVAFKKRSDGGYQITNINGRKYTGSSGNTIARKIVGAPLPQKLVKQRIKITKAREKKYKKIPNYLREDLKKAKQLSKKYGVKDLPIKNRKDLLVSVEKNGVKSVRKSIKKIEEFDKLSASFKDQFNKTKYALDHNENVRGKVSISITIDSVRKYGVREVKRKLKNIQLYAEGWAREKNVYWLCETIRAIEHKYEQFELEKVITYAMRHRIKDSALHEVYQELYKIDKGEIEINDATANILIAILKQ